MRSLRTRIWRGRTAGAALGAVVGLVALSTPAAQATATPKPGTNLIVNGQFRTPKPTKAGAPPAGWKLVDLGAETKPYSASIDVYNAKGKYPPPKGNPNKQDIAGNVFYESGTATGVEGIAGQQTSATFKSITQANNPQVSFSDVEVSGPATTNADWAGSGLEIDFTAAGKSFSLIYLNLWTPAVGTYPDKPVNSATTKYILGPTLKADKWNTQKARSLNADIKAQFKVTSYKVSDVRFIDLEDTINAAKPYANENGYVADVALDEGSS
jgi:hypothetical protein